MDQMADEMTLRADLKDKGRVSAAEESSAWVSGERIQREAQICDWRLGTTAETEPGETSRDADVRPRECDSSTSPLFSLKTYLRRSAASSSADSLSSSQQSNMGVDCAGIVLSCLFCRFYDMIHMIPDSCGIHCCPSYKQVVSTMDSASSSDDDSHIDVGCGLFSSCDDISDCVELAMEISEICYH
ncbi:myoD family inhibitor domain-containing protein 2 [Scomber scombrus]|uniref:myoD family inhibitor domain-containing protein 2 n=1 Tax=Scomber scombrus TaxID=13677 RepID=UPI002DDB943C|nr:myoD family inhibitor domain-containing protein 2 [Scomber scombrus]